jgi:hypothetical protein
MIDELYYFSNPALICYDGEDEGADAAAAEAAAAEAAAEAAEAEAAAVAAKAKAKLFSDPAQQAKFNDALAKEKRALEAKLKAEHKSQLEKTNHQLNELLESKNLSENERAKAEEAREDILKQLRTKEENAKIEKKKLETEYEARLAAAEKRAIEAETKYHNSTIHRSLLDAAVAGDAFNPDVLVTVLRGKTKMDDDGTIKVDLEGQDDAGNPVPLQMSPSEAVKWMKERSDQFGGLFKSNVVSGVGGTSGTGPMSAGKDGKVDVSKLTTEQYMELRKKNPAALGL